MAKSKVMGRETESCIPVILYHNERKGTHFKAYQFAQVSFLLGNKVPVPERDENGNLTGRYKRDESGNLVCGVSRPVSAVTAMGGNVHHAASALAGPSFGRTVKFLVSAMLPRRGKTMVTMEIENSTVHMECPVKVEYPWGDGESLVVTSSISDESVADARGLAANEIAGQIVARVVSKAQEYLNSLPPEKGEEEEIAGELESIKFS